MVRRTRFAEHRRRRTAAGRRRSHARPRKRPYIRAGQVCCSVPPFVTEGSGLRAGYEATSAARTWPRLALSEPWPRPRNVLASVGTHGRSNRAGRALPSRDLTCLRALVPWIGAKPTPGRLRNLRPREDLSAVRGLGLATAGQRSRGGRVSRVIRGPEGGVKLARRAAARIDRRAVVARWTQARQRAVPPKAKPGRGAEDAARPGAPRRLTGPWRAVVARIAGSRQGHGAAGQPYPMQGLGVAQSSDGATGDRGDNKASSADRAIRERRPASTRGGSRGPTIRYCWIVDPLDAPQLRASCRSSACPWLSRHAPGGRGHRALALKPRAWRGARAALDSVWAVKGG